LLRLSGGSKPLSGAGAARHQERAATASFGETNTTLLRRTTTRPVNGTSRLCS
jgi:hypothetical protein